PRAPHALSLHDALPISLTDNSVVILKFFLHVSRDEQKKRLVERLEDRKKNWKFRAGDLDDRELWSDYTDAYHDAIIKCSTSWARSEEHTSELQAPYDLV